MGGDLIGARGERAFCEQVDNSAGPSRARWNASASGAFIGRRVLAASPPFQFSGCRNMADTLDVVALIGSLRRESFTRRFTQALAALAPSSMRVELASVDLPLYNQDLDNNLPPASQSFRARIQRADGVLFATPEYNRSVPGVLKNAIDVGSRPEGQSVWAGKPAAIVSVTPYGLGAFGANHHLRQSFVFLDMPTLQQPELYVSRVESLLDPSGKISNAETKDLATKFLKTFEAWIRKHAPAR
jgi:chromate reductase